MRNQKLGKARNPWAVLGLLVITGTIYWYYWYYKVNTEIKEYDPTIEVNPTISLLAQFIPFANVVSVYNTANRLRQIQVEDEIIEASTISPIVALLLFLFLGYLYAPYLQDKLNEHWQHASNITISSKDKKIPAVREKK